MTRTKHRVTRLTLSALPGADQIAQQHPNTPKMWILQTLHAIDEDRIGPKPATVVCIIMIQRDGLNHLMTFLPTGGLLTTS